MTQIRQTPDRVHRRELSKPSHWHKVCTDDRLYMQLPMTISGPAPLVAGDYEPMIRVHRTAYVAKISVTVGKHDEDNHPDDGCPTGSSAKFNVRRVKEDLSGDAPIMASDDVLDVADGTHRDTQDNSHGNFAIDTLFEGQFIYPRIVSVGSTYPGRAAVIVVEIVPIRGIPPEDLL